MNKQIDLLASIQAKDLVLDELFGTIEKGPRRIEKRENAVADLDKDLAVEKDRIKETKKIQRQFEMDVESGIEKIKKSKTRLVEIKNNKEYQAVLREIDKLESLNMEKEEKILGCMEEMERHRQALREKKSVLKEVRGEFEQEVEEIRNELDAAQKKLSEEKIFRDQIAKDMDSKILAAYERLKTARSGMAVAEVNNATCSGCHMSIPPQMYNELQRRDKLEFCPNCDRIIYWNKVETPSNEEGMSE